VQTTSSWSPGLVYDVFYLYITSSTASKKNCKITAKQPQPRYHQQHTPPTHYQNKQKHLEA